MFKTHLTGFSTSGVLGPLVADYLNGKKDLEKFYSHFPDRDGFAKAIGTAPYHSLNRGLLTEILKRQAGAVNNTSPQSLAQIERLQHSNTFTVTTGHQLCLFTGPLYFIIKILSTINLAKELKTQFPAYEFVPVYWMASEDHDFEEVNHLMAYGRKIEWKSDQKGAVGDMSTKGLEEILLQLKEISGKSAHAPELLALFEESYLKHPDLKSATRFLVNALFGKQGLVIVDGHDPEFKKQFRDVFEKDILHQLPYQQVQHSISQLKELGYQAQVNPREINCFYLEPQQRNRIEKKDGLFQIAGTEKNFGPEQMQALIQDKPEFISPNVTLRPLYQQRILPNLAYIGGPGELAYWLEYRHMFDALGIFYPLLVPRNFFTIIEKNQVQRMEKLGISPEELFNPEEELIRQFQIKQNNVFEAQQEKEQLKSIYTVLLKRVQEIDKTLEASVSAELQKNLNGLEAIAGKVNRSLKQRSETEINQIKNLKQKLFPGGGPLERSENFSSFYLKYGPAFIDALAQEARPLLYQQVILEET